MSPILPKADFCGGLISGEKHRRDHGDGDDSYNYGEYDLFCFLAHMFILAGLCIFGRRRAAGSEVVVANHPA